MEKEKPIEKGARWYRNVNIITGVGALAIGAAIPGTREVMTVIAVIQGAQALGGEAVRQVVKRRRVKQAA